MSDVGGRKEGKLQGSAIKPLLQNNRMSFANALDNDRRRNYYIIIVEQARTQNTEVKAVFLV